MILTDEIADRIHRLSLATLRNVAHGAFRVRPDAVGKDIGTGYALFAGAGSPLTQVAGFAHRKPGDVAEIEAFFAPLTQEWEAGATPWTDPAAFRALTEAGYRPQQFEGELAQWVGDVPEPDIEIVEVGFDLDAWMETTFRGWTEIEGGSVEPDELVRMMAAAPGRRYLAFVDGQPAATASLYEHKEGVVLGGAATRVPYRGYGLQNALLHRRLRDVGQGRFALIGAMPGTTSFRNAQRAGFTPLFSKVTLLKS